MWHTGGNSTQLSTKRKQVGKHTGGIIRIMSLYSEYSASHPDTNRFRSRRVVLFSITYAECQA